VSAHNSRAPAQSERVVVKRESVRSAYGWLRAALSRVYHLYGYAKFAADYHRHRVRIKEAEIVLDKPARGTIIVQDLKYVAK
jgi:3-phenylpropionate/cinnamic acid dioxygenase small subunit